MSGPIRFIFFIFAALSVFGENGALADGCYFPPTTHGDQVPVDMDAQMAIIVIHETGGSWDLYLRTSYSGDPASFGWVVPFSARPYVDPEPASEAFFKDMDDLTAIYFFYENCIEECQPTYCGPGGAAMDGGGNGVDSGKVTVWQAGKIGILEYVVLSSSDGEDLVAWLEDNDFVISSQAAPIIETLAEEGSFFFAAKIDTTLEEVRNIAPILAVRRKS